MPADGQRRVLKKLSDGHRGPRHASLGQRHRPHRHAHDSARARVDTHPGGDPRRSRQQEAAASGVVVNGGPDPVPDLWHELPLVDEDGRGRSGDGVDIGCERFAFCASGQGHDGLGPAARRRGFADAFGALQRDGREVGKQLVEGVVDDASPVGHGATLHSYTTNSHFSILQIAIILHCNSCADAAASSRVTHAHGRFEAAQPSSAESGAETPQSFIASSTGRKLSPSGVSS